MEFFPNKQSSVYSQCFSPNKLWVYPWELTNVMNLRPHKTLKSWFILKTLKPALFTYKMGARSKTPQGSFKFHVTYLLHPVLLWQYYNYSNLVKVTWKYRDKQKSRLIAVWTYFCSSCCADLRPEQYILLVATQEGCLQCGTSQEATVSPAMILFPKAS